MTSVLTKPAYIILEEKENLKNDVIANLVYNVIALCVKNFNHGFGATTSIMQCLGYFEHLAEPMADLLGVAYNKYEESKVVEDVLRLDLCFFFFFFNQTIIKKFNQTTKCSELSKLSISVNDAAAKSYSPFLARLSEKAPKPFHQKMSLLINLIDCEVNLFDCTFEVANQ